MSIHDGHRQRIKDRFIHGGLEGFSDHEVLELLLFYCIPRRDTNLIAHKLIEKFGSFVQVMQAPVRELEKVEGVGKNAAVFLSLLRESYRHYSVSHAKLNKQLKTVDEYGGYMHSFFLGKQNELVYFLCLDANSRVIDCFQISEGGITSANVSIRKVVDIAINSNAVTAVLAHNHPCGLALPSADDIQTTKRIAKALMMTDVILTDHIIVGGNDYISLYQSGLYDPTKISFDD